MAYLNRRVSVTTEVFPELQPVQGSPLIRPTRKKGFLVQQQAGSLQNSNIRYWFYILINAALLFGVIQCVRVLVMDSLRLAALAQSQVTVQHLYAQSRQDHQTLQTKIKVYSSRSGIEELARNYLNMVGKNELPVHFQAKVH